MNDELHDLVCRLGDARRTLSLMVDQTDDPYEQTRLRGKIEGVMLAESYIADAQRNLRQR